MRCFIMKSRPLAPALTIGCQHSTGWRSGRGTSGVSLSSEPRYGTAGGRPGGVPPAPPAEAGAPAGEDVGGGEILRQPERVPHGGDVEAAPDAQSPRQMGQVDGDHQDIRNALVALVLEVVLGQPKGVVPEIG